MSKNALIFTLGCRLNSADTALLTNRLEKAGYTIVQDQQAFLQQNTICMMMATTGVQ